MGVCVLLQCAVKKLLKQIYHMPLASAKNDNNSYNNKTNTHKPPSPCATYRKLLYCWGSLYMARIERTLYKVTIIYLIEMTESLWIFCTLAQQLQQSHQYCRFSTLIISLLSSFFLGTLLNEYYSTF